MNIHDHPLKSAFENLSDDEQALIGSMYLHYARTLDCIRHLSDADAICEIMALISSGLVEFHVEHIHEDGRVEYTVERTV